MRILHVITSLEMGGAEKLMVDLLPRLRDRGHQVELAIFNGRKTPFYDELIGKNVTIHTLNKPGTNIYSPLNLVRLVRLIKRGKYDIVHTHNTASQIFGAISKVLCSVVLCTTEHTTSNRRRRWRWYKVIDRWMYKRYDRVVCISQKAQDNLEEYMGASRCFLTINNGVDVSRFMHPVKTLNPDDEIWVLMVSAFRWEKDQDTLVKALRYLPGNVKLRLVGNGIRRREVEQLAEKEGVSERVDFAGLQTDIPNQLSKADIVVMSSHFEGLSLSSVEGMASGRPFMASDVDGLREVVGDFGLLFPHEDAKACAEQISRLISNPVFYRKIAERCIERAKQFDIATMAEAYCELYNAM